MHLPTSTTTQRLSIERLALHNNKFIRELVNTEGWIQFIGNRSIYSDMNATTYIQKIIDNPNLNYWVVQLKDTKTEIGLITFIKRDYLDHHDIGFAFLPNFQHHGYAYEASHAILDSILAKDNCTHVLATTIPENTKSIALLKKLGLSFEKEIEPNNVKLWVYGVQYHEEECIKNAIT